MPGNNSIQILRGSNVKSSSASNEVLLAGQPLYDLSTGYLYIGDGEANIRTIQAINARYANSAGTANTTYNLYISGSYSNGTTYNTAWRGNLARTIYVPRDVGSTGQVWGMINNTTPGWISQEEMPTTVNHANTADVAYSVSGINVTGTVANANYANYAGVAYNVSARDAATSLYICGPSTATTNIVGSAAINLNAYANITMNANNYININSRGPGGIIRVNGTSLVDIRSGGEVSIDSNSAYIVANGINISTKSLSQSVSINGYNVNVNGASSVKLNSKTTMNLESATTLTLEAPSITFSTMPTVNGTAINNRANVAGRVENNLYFNGSYLNIHNSRVTYNTAWNGSTSDTIYVPTIVGDKNQVWGMVNDVQVGWMDSPGFTYQGFIDSNGYSINGKRILAICTYGSAAAYIRRSTTNVVTGIRGPVVSIDATRGSDSSVVYITESGTPSHATFNSNVRTTFNAPGDTRWSIFTYSSI